MKYTIDAKDKKLGRVASQAAGYLIGKSLVTVTKNNVSDVKVEIINASKLVIDPNKATATKFYHHSGYPGGIKKMTLAEFITKKGYPELVRKTIYGMLPTNSLRSKMIKNLNVTE